MLTPIQMSFCMEICMERSKKVQNGLYKWFGDHTSYPRYGRKVGAHSYASLTMWIPHTFFWWTVIGWVAFVASLGPLSFCLARLLLTVCSLLLGQSRGKAWPWSSVQGFCFTGGQGTKPRAKLSLAGPFARGLAQGKCVCAQACMPLLRLSPLLS